MFYIENIKFINLTKIEKTILFSCLFLSLFIIPSLLCWGAGSFFLKNKISNEVINASKIFFDLYFCLLLTGYVISLWTASYYFYLLIPLILIMNVLIILYNIYDLVYKKEFKIPVIMNIFSYT